MPGRCTRTGPETCAINAWLLVFHFLKQRGEWLPGSQESSVPGNWKKDDYEPYRFDGWCTTYRVGKRGGRLLDGREWNEFPATEREDR